MKQPLIVGPTLKEALAWGRAQGLDTSRLVSARAPDAIYQIKRLSEGGFDNTVLYVLDLPEWPEDSIVLRFIHDNHMRWCCLKLRYS